MIKFEPIKDFIRVERAIDKGSKLVMPDQVQATSDDVFRVLAVGPGDDEHPMFLKAGDLICIVGYINPFSYKGENVILARARDVMCLIKES